MYFTVRALLIMTSILKQLVVPKGKSTSTGPGRSQPELNQDSEAQEKQKTEEDRNENLDPVPAPPHSPSPEAEYDKLLVSKSVDFTFCKLYIIVIIQYTVYCM